MGSIKPKKLKVGAMPHKGKPSMTPKKGFGATIADVMPGQKRKKPLV